MDFGFSMFSYTALGFLFVLGVVVFFHELGHFWVARLCGVTVDTFSVGFGKEIWGFNDKKGTRWKLSWIPLGGYVKFADDNSAASTPNRNKKAASPDEEAGFFHNKPLSSRVAVVAAGPIANFILAIVIFAAIAMTAGRYITEPVIGSIQQGSVAEEKGFLKGDIIKSVNGESIDSFEQVNRTVFMSMNRPLTFEINRGGVSQNIIATPKQTEITDRFGETNKIGVLGIGPIEARPIINTIQLGSSAEKAGFQVNDLVLQIDEQKIETFRELREIVSQSPEKPLKFNVLRGGNILEIIATPKRHERANELGKTIEVGLLGVTAKPVGSLRKAGLIDALNHGVKETWATVKNTLVFIYELIMGRQDADALGGPIKIAKVSGQAASIGFEYLISLTAILSVSIGLFNLFPIPMLDGGHLLFYFFEALRGKPLSEKTQEIGFRIGIVLLVSLMIFATWNDIT